VGACYLKTFREHKLSRGKGKDLGRKRGGGSLEEVKRLRLAGRLGQTMEKRRGLEFQMDTALPEFGLPVSRTEGMVRVFKYDIKGEKLLVKSAQRKMSRHCRMDKKWVKFGVA